MNDDIRQKRLIYHLTSLENLPSILTSGLLPRAQLNGFVDVADHEILEDRKRLQLEKCVPFHFFAKNPFDGRVQRDHPDKQFALIAVRREVARLNGWKIIPRHPLAGDGIQLLDYDGGMEAIDWETMNRRDYSDHESKCVCMAECVAPGPVSPTLFQSITVKDEKARAVVRGYLAATTLQLYVDANAAMFKK
ncbi:DarT ssDNA thymidine ADP-ribosyltransferase family protein [Ideonella alba]|uniref:DUF4433 domain-containing protein n=1 Tax=Ideonella alba TaxID=2824118 RepID=A0A940Y530_9BURK|nr:DarT ssDNA thymidine ADP-ribosyltransferase family protein [Ideonella alba]MBQ0928858.1 DUF4433 domain-containing protein [Ideonella alba]